jgi:hypothetical protein
MLDSSIVEVAVGLIAVFSLLAILVTQINMVLSNLFNLRARHLKRALKALIVDPEIQARLLTHPLIGLVRVPLNPEQPVSAQAAQRISETDTSDVSWIAPSVFADVMVDLVSAQAGDGRDLYAPVLNVANSVLEPAQQGQSTL